jgi:hypothetical protein
MRFFYLLVTVCSVSLTSFAGNNKALFTPDTPLSAAAAYLRSADEQAVVFTGKEHEKYPIHYANSPWLKSTEYTRGILYANKKVYPDVQMKLDLYRNELVISPDNSPYNIVTTADSAFLHTTNVYFIPPMPNQNLSGYVVVLHRGKHKLYLKYHLQLRQQVESGRVVYRFETSTSHWLHTSDGLFKLARISDLYPFFPEERRNIRAFLHNNHLNFRKNPDLTLTRLMDYLDN